VQSAIENGGLLWANGGNVTVNGAVSGSGSALVSGSATLEFGASSSAKTAFDAGATGILKLDDSFHFSGTVSGLSDTSQIDFADIEFGAGTSFAYHTSQDGTGGTLTISDGAHISNIALIGQYDAGGFTLSTDSAGIGTLIRYHPV
jgi:hypothetical protein